MVSSQHIINIKISEIFCILFFSNKFLPLAVYFMAHLNLDEPHFKYSVHVASDTLVDSKSSKPFKGFTRDIERALKRGRRDITTCFVSS